MPNGASIGHSMPHAAYPRYIIFKSFIRDTYCSPVKELGACGVSSEAQPESTNRSINVGVDQIVHIESK